MSKNRKLRATWVRILGANVKCDTLTDYGKKDGLFRKLVVINGEKVVVACPIHKGTYERTEEPVP
ncbi:MAG: hypothetical protein OXJ55_07965 [Caldilineaceae bacterium]|nr:hypothetical protein [Caldilineaceae bacterium]